MNGKFSKLFSSEARTLIFWKEKEKEEEKDEEKEEAEEEEEEEEEKKEEKEKEKRRSEGQPKISENFSDIISVRTNLLG
ncbi:hypothetical protein M8J75_003713 [Diaphorina citri]|nr:hypothetical protein M8J75_003713 [Diaphorina citri]